ncbi:glycosyltransferase [Pseudomonas silesiensis]|uniref:glycosyltransferase n=1 Tax=Pseudomonas silesiensis TaxID=1853130 RepID=UPI0034D3BA54
MNIYVLPSWYPPNGGHFFEHQAKCLSKVGHNVVVLAPISVSARNPIKWMVSWFTIGKVKHSIENDLHIYRSKYPLIPKLNLINARLYAWSALKCFKFAKNKTPPPQIIHAHSLIWAGYAASIIKERYKIPYFVTEHRGRFINNKYVDKNQIIEMRSKLVQSAGAGANKLYAVSGAMLPFLREKIKSPSVELGVIGNMVDVDFFTPSNLKLKNSNFRFFSLASLIKLKGFDDLISSFEKLLEKHPCTELYIGGSGSEEKELQALITTKNLGSKITLLGALSREEVKVQMQMADAFILATKYEAFGIVFIEAMACGLPIVTTRSGGPEEIVTKEIGLLSTPGDTRAMMENMATLIENYKSYDKKLIRDIAEKRYSEHSITIQLERNFKEIIGLEK